MFPSRKNSQKRVKNQKSTDKHSSFDGLIQEDIDLSDIYLAVTLFQEGGRLCPPHYCLPTRIFRPSYCSELYAQCTYIYVAVRFGTQLIVAVALTLRMCILRDGQT